MRFADNIEPMQQLFMDIIDLPQSLNAVPEFSHKQALFIICAISRYSELLALKDKSSSAIINALEPWIICMRRKGLKTMVAIRADEGTAFSSDEFKQ